MGDTGKFRPLNIDEIAWTYCAEVGWSLDRLLGRDDAVGWTVAEREWEPARAHAVQRVVEDHPEAVIAFGAGYTSFTRADHAARVRRALAPVPDVVHGAGPAESADELVRLRERLLAELAA